MSRCAAADCPGVTQPKFITLAVGERGGAGDYEALYACCWACAVVVANEQYKKDAYQALENL